MLLSEKYKPVLSRDPTFAPMISQVAHRFFGIEPPRGAQQAMLDGLMNGPLGAMMSGLGGGGGGAGGGARGGGGGGGGADGGNPLAAMMQQMAGNPMMAEMMKNMGRNMRR